MLVIGPAKPCPPAQGFSFSTIMSPETDLPAFKLMISAKGDHSDETEDLLYLIATKQEKKGVNLSKRDQLRKMTQEEQIHYYSLIAKQPFDFIHIVSNLFSMDGVSKEKVEDLTRSLQTKPCSQDGC